MYALTLFATNPNSVFVAAGASTFAFIFAPVSFSSHAKHYAELRAAGDSTLSERMEMLVQHRQALNEQIARLQEHKIKLDEKIEFYRNEIERVQQNMS